MLLSWPGGRRQEGYYVIYGLQTARQMQRNVDAAMSREGMSRKSRTPFKGDVEPGFPNMFTPIAT